MNDQKSVKEIVLMIPIQTGKVTFLPGKLDIFLVLTVSFSLSLTTIREFQLYE